VNPLLHILGSPGLLDKTKIPRFQISVSVVEQWALDVLFNLNPRREELQDMFMGNFLDATILSLGLGAACDSSLVARDIFKVPCVPRHQGAHPLLPHPSLWLGVPGHSQYALWPLANFLLGRGDLLQAIRVLQ